jgi:hypothetical protein
VDIHGSLTSALVGGEWSASRPGRFTSGERETGTHWIGGCVGPRAGLHAAGKILDPTGTRTPVPLGRPAHSQSLYRLRYRNSYKNLVRMKICFAFYRIRLQCVYDLLSAEVKGEYSFISIHLYTFMTWY